MGEKQNKQKNPTKQNCKKAKKKKKKEIEMGRTQHSFGFTVE